MSWDDLPQESDMETFQDIAGLEESGANCIQARYHLRLHDINQRNYDWMEVKQFLAHILIAIARIMEHKKTRD